MFKQGQTVYDCVIIGLSQSQERLYIDTFQISASVSMPLFPDRIRLDYIPYQPTTLV